MRYVLVSLAVVAGVYGLHRAALWAEQRGWIHYRKRGASGALGNAFLEVQAILEPSKRYVVEQKTRSDAEADETGDPPNKADA